MRGSGHKRSWSSEEAVPRAPWVIGRLPGGGEKYIGSWRWHTVQPMEREQVKETFWWADPLGE